MEAVYSTDHSELYASAEDSSRLRITPNDEIAQGPEKPTQAQLLEANIELFAHASAIPLQNRLRYLIGDEELSERSGYRYTDLDDLAVKLGAEQQELVQIIEDLGIPTELTPIDQFNNLVLAPHLDIVIAEEFKWRTKYENLQDEVTPPTIADALSVHIKIVDRVLKTTGIQPKKVYEGSVTKHYYPKALAYRIRSEEMMFPPARQNKNMAQVIGAVGCGRAWAENRVDGNTYPDLFKGRTGRVDDHYPPEFEQYLRIEHENRPETAPEGMRTVARLAADLDRDVDWVSTRLIRYFRQKRTLIVSGVDRTLYDENVFKALKQLSDEQHQLLPIPDGWVILSELIEPLETTRETADVVLQRMGILPVRRRDANTGKEAGTYPLDIRLSLAAEIVKYREEQLAEINLTIANLSAQPRNTLSLEGRKKYKTIKAQLAVMSKHLQRAQATYDRLMTASLENQS